MVDPISAVKADVKADARYDNIEDEVKKLKDEINNLSSSLRSIAKDAASLASDRVHDKLDVAKEEARNAVGATQRVVGDHPLTAVALAVGLGVVLGQMMRR